MGTDTRMGGVLRRSCVVLPGCRTSVARCATMMESESAMSLEVGLRCRCRSHPRRDASNFSGSAARGGRHGRAALPGWIIDPLRLQIGGLSINLMDLMSMLDATAQWHRSKPRSRSKKMPPRKSKAPRAIALSVMRTWQWRQQLAVLSAPVCSPFRCYAIRTADDMTTTRPWC